MKRSTTEMLAELGQLDPERLSATNDRPDPDLSDVTKTTVEMILARILATPRTEEIADHGIADHGATVRVKRMPGGRRGGPTNIRRLGIVVGTVALIGLVLGLILSTGGKSPVRVVARHDSSTSAALHPILTALTSTTAAENYAFNYSTTFQPGSTGSNSAVPSPAPLDTSGHGVVDLDPYAMLTTNSPDSSFPNVTGVFDSTDAWEFGAGDYGTHGLGGSAPGMPIAGFAQSVEGSLGQGQGALEMIGLSYPTGRLNLDQNTVTSAQAIGTGTVDGLAVTNYRVTIDLSRVLDQPGLTEQQQTTITQALAILTQQGYEGTSEIVSIDGAGYIREVKSIASFSDGGSVTNDSILSQIGCAGTVTPGQPVVTAAPPTCVSPDQPGAPTPTPTSSSSTTVPSTTTTTTTTAPTAPTSTTLMPGSTASAASSATDKLLPQGRVLPVTSARSI